MSVSIKSPEDIAGMRVAGRVASEVLDFITPYVKPGVTTGDLDRLCNEFIVNEQKVIPANVGYTPPGHTHSTPVMPASGLLFFDLASTASISSSVMGPRD